MRWSTERSPPSCPPTSSPVVWVPTEIGAVITATLLGSAVVTLLLGLRGGHSSASAPVVALLMIATGVAFGLAALFAFLVVIAAVGTLNPSGGDVSPFLPIEQSLASGHGEA